MHLNVARALLVTLLVTFARQGKATGFPISECPDRFTIALSEKIDPVLRSLIHNVAFQGAERSFVIVHIEFKKYISLEKIKRNIRKFSKKNNYFIKTSNQLDCQFVFDNDPFIVESLADLASIDEVKNLTLESSTDNTNNQLDIVASKYPSSELAFKAFQFKNEPQVIVQFPSNYLSQEEIKQAATIAIFAATPKAQFPVYKTSPVSISVTTILTTSSYNDDKSIFTRGSSITFDVKVTTPGVREPNIRVAVTRNSITGAFDYGRVE